MTAHTVNSFVVGTWNGKVEIGETAVPIVVHIASDEEGLLVRADLPQFGLAGVVYEGAAAVDDVVRFRSNSLGDYVGRIDGDCIVGAFAKKDQRYALTLFRGEAAISEPAHPQLPQPPFDYVIEEVLLQSDGCCLAGTLTRPTDAARAAVLLVTGSGAMDRDETVFGHKPFLVLADFLTRRGYAVLRLDDRGVGASTGERASITVAVECEDMSRAFDYLRCREDLAGVRVGLIGHSAGSGIARLVAAHCDDVAFVVSMAGAGLDFGATLADRECRLIAQRGWADAGGIDRHRAFTLAIYADLAARRDDALLDATQVDTMAQQFGAASTAAMFFVPAWVARCNTPWLRSLLRVDTRAATSRMRAPFLALNGQRDTQVPAAPHLAAMAAALAAAGNPDVEMRELPGLNLLFQTAATGEAYEYPQITETFAPRALEAIGDWLDKRFAPAP